MATNLINTYRPEGGYGSPAELNTEWTGKRGTVEFDGLTVSVEVTEARVRFGRLDLRVTPLAGTGTRWIERHRVRFD